jgi:hypothetical protein
MIYPMSEVLWEDLSQHWEDLGMFRGLQETQRQSLIPLAPKLGVHLLDSGLHEEGLWQVIA